MIRPNKFLRIFGSSGGKLFSSKKVLKGDLKKEDLTYDKLVGDYLNDINASSTDFKQEFGLVEAIKDAHQRTKSIERRFSHYFTFFWAILVSGGFVYFLSGLQRNQSAKKSKIFETYKCSLRLFCLGFIETNHALLKKIETMEKYLEALNKIKQTNCLYFQRIINHTHLILSRVDASYEATKGKKNGDFELILEKIPKIIETMFPSLSHEKNQQYHDTFQSSLSEISKILRKYNIILNEEVASFLLKSPDIFIQNEALNLYALHFEASPRKDLKANSDLANLKEAFATWINKPDFPSSSATFAQLSSGLKRTIALKNLSILAKITPEIKTP